MNDVCFKVKKENSEEFNVTITEPWSNSSQLNTVPSPLVTKDSKEGAPNSE